MLSLGFAIAMAAALPCASADFYLHHWENQWKRPKTFVLSPEVAFYSTRVNYSYLSKRVIPPGMGDSGYQRFQVDVPAAFGITDRITMYGRLAWSWFQLDHDTKKGSRYGLADQTLGFLARAWRSGGLALDLQLQADLPAYSNKSAYEQSLLFLGDGSYDFTVGAFFGLPLGEFGAYKLDAIAGTGFTYRTAKFSTAVPYSGMVKLEPIRDGFVASTGLAGFQSLGRDSSGKSGLDSTESQTSSGGSFVVNAVNPSLLSWLLRAGYRVSPRIAVSARVAKSIWGQRSPDGFSAGVFFEAAWPVGRAGRPGSEEYAGGNQGFLNYALDARVIDSSERLNLIKIDRGLNDGVEVGHIFDIFSVKNGQQGEAVARAKVTKVENNDAELSVTEYFKEVWIDKGFVAKRLAP